MMKKIPWTVGGQEEKDCGISVGSTGLRHGPQLIAPYLEIALSCWKDFLPFKIWSPVPLNIFLFSNNTTFLDLSDWSKMDTDDLSSEPHLSSPHIDNIMSSPQVLENLSSPELLANLSLAQPDNVTWVSLVELMGNSTDWRQQLDFSLLQVWRWHCYFFSKELEQPTKKLTLFWPLSTRK